MRLEPLDVLVERVDEHPERQVALELRRGSGEHRGAHARQRERRARRAGGSCRFRARRRAASAADRPSSSSASASIERASSSARPTRCSASNAISFLGEHRPEQPRSRNQGGALMSARPRAAGSSHVPLPAPPPSRRRDECGVVFAAFKGHQSPLRHQPTLASCRSGGHAIWWTVDAASEREDAPPAPVLRRRAHHRGRGQRGRDPIAPTGTSQPPSERSLSKRKEHRCKRPGSPAMHCRF